MTIGKRLGLHRRQIVMMDVDARFRWSGLSGSAPCRCYSQAECRNPAGKKISARFAWRIIWQIERRRAAGA